MYSGSDSITTPTTLNFTNPHGEFNLRIWVKKTNWNSGSELYSVVFYDSAGRTTLWSAANQSARTYYVGGNVTKIVVKRNILVASAATTYWQRV